ncbi:MAG TPA: flagellar basal body protein [Acidimicrobiales bacterium]|nr:flagellar basal body protein [Acidimicrobiales bacterium]
MTLFTDRITAGIESALDSVSLRQRVSADNIANMNTPGFKASRVEFESNLRQAMNDGNPQGAQPSVVATSDPANADGNNVMISNEQSTLVKSEVQFDALVAALNYKFATLRTAIKGQ